MDELNEPLINQEENQPLFPRLEKKKTTYIY